MPPARTVALALLGTTLLGACGGSGGDETIVATASVAAFEMRFDPTELHVPEGRVRFAVTNEGRVPHTFVIEARGFKLKAFTPGKTVTGTVRLPQGAYFFYCDIREHREAGMEGALYVGDVDDGSGGGS